MSAGGGEEGGVHLRTGGGCGVITQVLYGDNAKLFCLSEGAGTSY